LQDFLVRAALDGRLQCLRHRARAEAHTESDPDQSAAAPAAFRDFHIATFAMRRLDFDQACSAGMRMRMPWMIAGPRMTMKRTGKMKNMSGKSIFTGSLAAISSARSERSVRIASEWTRSA